MTHYYDVVLDRAGNAKVGAAVAVYNTGTVTLATLYSDDGITPLTNPLITDYNGTFAFYVADGNYDITVSGTGITTRTETNVTIGATHGVLYAEQFTGADLGAKINAAIAKLGSGNPGTIMVPPGGGTLSTLVTLGKKHKLVFGAGTYTTVGIRFSDSLTDISGSGSIEGAGSGVTTLILANGANTDVISQTNFASLTGTLSSFGMFRPVVRGCTIDGNKANNTAGYGIRLYGTGIILDRLCVQNAFNDGIYTEWGNDLAGPNTGQVDMSGHFSFIRSQANGGTGWTHFGPHDSQFVAINCVDNVGWGWTDGSSLAGQVGNGGGTHIWNMNSYNNVGGAFRTRLGVTAFDLATSTGSGDSILLDSLGGPSYLTNPTGATVNAGAIGLHIKNIGNVITGGEFVNNAGVGSIAVKIEGGGSNSVSGRWLNNAIAISEVSGANQISGVVEGIGASQVLFGSGPQVSSYYNLHTHINGVDSNLVQAASGGSGTKWGVADGLNTFTNTNTFTGTNPILLRTATNGFVQFVNSVNTNLPYMEWRLGTGTRLAYLGNGGTNFDVNLENGAAFNVSGGTTSVGAFSVSGTINGFALLFPSAADTLVGKATTDVFTNKTFNTGATGNVFQIAGTGITAVTGTGSAVLATTPTLVTPILGAATGTSLNLGATGVLSTTAQSGTGSIAMTNTPTLVTPVLGAATGTSLNLGATGVLSTTAQSGTGSIAMTTNAALTTPNIGAASGTSLALTGKIGTYNNVATVANGVSQLVAFVNSTALTANVGSTLLYAVPAAQAGMYRVSAYLVVTTAGTTSTLPACAAAWTDNDTNVAVGGFSFTPTNGGNTVGTTSSAQVAGGPGTMTFNAKASTNINYSTSGYASTGTAMQYALHIKLEYLGN